MDAKEELKGLAHRIRSLRERQGLTQEDFARQSGISVSFASLLERGARSPSYETLLQVAAALRISPSDLFRDAPAEPYDDPYFSRLLEFARTRRLTRVQVDKLLAVGTAMFEEKAGPRPEPTARRDGGTCSIDGCGRAVLARGLCTSHYHRQRRASGNR
ncbi:MAG: helix-turn-helix domain-containing protein [Myxococcota bacterium]|nr:helix-turn-helix domain-containing protein [Myxococcota bacterium]